MIPNVRIARRIRSEQGVILKTEIGGSWIVHPGDKAKLEYIRRELAVFQAEEPDAGWTLEGQGTDVSWHPMEGL